jgi:hypothetical protein
MGVGFQPPDENNKPLEAWPTGVFLYPNVGGVSST